MLKRKKIVRSLLVATLLLFCAAQPAIAAEFLLFYANDVHAEIEPCG